MDQIKESFTGGTSDTEPPREGGLTRSVEQVTAKVPSMAYLGLALGSLALSATLAGFTERKWLANFVGHWVPTLLLIGVYNKLVKLEGSDFASSEQEHLH